MAIVRNTKTGIITSVPDHYVGHPVLGKNLVLATDKAQAAPKKETPKKEQPAPEAPAIEPEPEINIEENEE